ncbi:MAG: tyrosine-type recombinase/integrase [bacterium]|nr:tyrosine-type recombinase/integrase [bacterium]
MTRKMRLSDRAVVRLNAASSEYTVWDTRITGLGVRVRPSGHRSFVVMDNRNGASKRRTLGPVTHMTVEKARSRCLGIQSGDMDLIADKTLAPVPLFCDFVANVWRPECFDRFKPSSRRPIDSALTNQLLPTFGNMRLDRIGRKEVTAWFDRYSGVAPGGANAALDTLRQILNRAKVHGHLETNPASGIRRNPQRRFNRFLSRDEAIRLPAELDRLVAERPERAAQADIIRLLFWTGCRLGEIRRLKWCEIGTDTLDLGDAKTGARKVYLNSEARRIIERQRRTGSEHVFPSPSDPTLPVSRSMKLWFTLRRRAGIEDVRLHDLRHNFASQAVLNGVPLPTVARLLGHRQGSMTLRYAHVADREVEVAAERVGDAITAICNSTDS